jgi:hypothetical protein
LRLFETVCEHIIKSERNKEGLTMTDNEKELINIIRTSEDPQKVAEYMLNLFLDYLRTNAPSEEKAAASPRESA